MGRRRVKKSDAPDAGGAQEIVTTSDAGGAQKIVTTSDAGGAQEIVTTLDARGAQELSPHQMQEVPRKLLLRIILLH